MTAGIDAVAGKALALAGRQVFGTIQRRLRNHKVQAESRAVVSVRVAERLAEDLSDVELAGLADYLSSPEFDEVALQLVLSEQILPDGELRYALHEQLRQGMRHCMKAPADVLLRAADVLLDALLVGFQQAHPHVVGFDSMTAASTASLATAAARNGELLGRLDAIVRIRQDGAQLRQQVRRLNGRMRLPHAGVSRTATYEQLYVMPPLLPRHEDDLPPVVADLATPGVRTVILGAPGAGKSTLMAKLAHDAAAGRIEGAQRRVPFLVTLRDHVDDFRRNAHTLGSYLQLAARAPYNVDLSADAVDYLLGNGQALVLLDGLDELVDPALRGRVGNLIEGFAHRYPLVPMVVTSRIVGYEVAPLDSTMFETVTLGDFTDEQVADYARRWFVLDDATPAQEQARLTESFLRDSVAAQELRRSPLLLSLLCAMYSYERYIPRNLASIYERCATMLFDQWDSMRGISVPMKFQGRVRYAVQHLAWRYFSEDLDPQPGPRVTAVLAEYLTARGHDRDDAEAAAEGFLEMCTGRAWILADVGTDRSAPLYGFTHRTFLEYFAAEHLVRTHRTAEDLIAALRPRLEQRGWEVVGQIALQLFDRHVDGGATETLETLLAGHSASVEERSAVLAFCARSLAHVGPEPATVAAIVNHAIDLALRFSFEDRCRYWPNAEQDTNLHLFDGPLYQALYVSSADNLEYVRRTVLERLTALVADGSPVGTYLAATIGRRMNTDDAARGDVWEAVAATFGPAPRLGHYVADAGLCGTTIPAPVDLLRLDLWDSARELRDELLRSPAPGLPGRVWNQQRSGISWLSDYLGAIQWPANDEDRATVLVLLLPYLETLSLDMRLDHHISAFAFDRRNRTEKVDISGFPAEAREFLDRWRRGLVSVFD
ncbi:NACHT domain-containing protein [Dactylosporangium sp. CS-047395]|uniref:NACHT domain-containing protein n=1 Tax=Dactylosporangium sp. CS-047395 TaxID=3239936 RepID=UPI003D938BB9